MIWVSGPTGAGKTTLAQLLRESDFAVVEESVPKDLFGAFMSAPDQNCERLQRYIMQARFDGWSRVSAATRIAFDRSIDEDIEVFCKMHWRAGYLTTEQFTALAEFGRGLQERLPGPDMILFVTSDRGVLKKRMQNLSAPELMIDSVDEQLALYKDWLHSRGEESVQFDTSRLSEGRLAKLIREIRSC